jgi:hypothetical protein
MDALPYTPEFLPLAEASFKTSRVADGWICSSIPEMQRDTITRLEKEMGMPIIGVGLVHT